MVESVYMVKGPDSYREVRGFPKPRVIIVSIVILEKAAQLIVLWAFIQNHSGYSLLNLRLVGNKYL